MNIMGKLYNLSTSIDAARRAAEMDAEANNGEVSEYLWDALLKLSTDRNALICESSILVKTMQLELDAITSRMAEIKRMKEQHEASIDSLRKGIASLLQEGETIRVPEIGSVYRKASQSAEVIGDVPHEDSTFIRHKVEEKWEADKKAIIDAYKSGKDIPEWVKVNNNVTCIIKS